MMKNEAKRGKVCQKKTLMLFAHITNATIGQRSAARAFVPTAPFTLPSLLRIKSNPINRCFAGITGLIAG
jgi:hypothetical protein